MSQEAVERTLGRLLTDEDFRGRFFESPEVTCWKEGLRLSPAELEALARLSRTALAELGAGLDPRIRRLGLESRRPGQDGRDDAPE